MRDRSLIMSERGMVGPMLATFIAALSLRHNQSRTKIAELLKDWLGLELSEGAIDRCIHEFGCASEPVVEELLKEVRAAEVVNLDETPWWQNGVLLWMWVAVTSNAGRLPHRQPPQGGTGRSDRRSLPRLDRQ